jgi:signal transduction histidine kinase
LIRFIINSCVNLNADIYQNQANMISQANPSFKIYAFLSRLKWLRTYHSKFLFIAFLGTHIPLLGLIIYISLFQGELSTLTILLVTLILTLFTTGITLYALSSLLSPITFTKGFIEEYLHKRKIHNLDINFLDEAGQLMLQVNYFIRRMESAHSNSKDLLLLLTHELRAPLNQMIHFLELKSSLSEKESNTLSQELISTCNHQMHILQKLIDSNKMEVMHYDKSNMNLSNLSQLFDECILAESSEINSKGLQIQNNLPSDKSLFVQPEYFKMVIQNLINNAVKFSEHNGVINLKYQTIHDFALIEVIDEGAGFDPVLEEELFDRYTQLHKKQSDNDSYIGLGLYNSKTIIQKHFGTIQANSEGVGKGATFSIKIPLNLENLV